MNKREKSLSANYNNAIKNKNNNVKYYIDESDVGIWYVMFCGIAGGQDEFQFIENDVVKQGEYIMQIIASSDHPFKPPRFNLLTPNGIFVQGKEPCVSIGHYHSNNYTPTMGITGFIDNIYSAMICWDSLKGGINIVNDISTESLRKYARESEAYNMKHNNAVRDKILKAYDEYSKLWV